MLSYKVPAVFLFESCLIVTKLICAIPALQLIGISVTGLEPEFQPVVNQLLPQIISNKQDANDTHLQVGHDVDAI